MNWVNISKLVKSTRKINNITQKQLADELGVQLQLISNIERGLTGFPPARVRVLHDKYGVTLNRIKTAMVKDYRLNLENKISNELRK